MTNFEQKIKDIGNEAIDYIYNNAKTPYAVKEDGQLPVTAFNFDGEPIEVFARIICSTYILSEEAVYFGYTDISNQSCARIADYLSKLKEEENGKKD